MSTEQDAQEEAQREEVEGKTSSNWFTPTPTPESEADAEKPPVQVAPAAAPAPEAAPAPKPVAQPAPASEATASQPEKPAASNYDFLWEEPPAPQKDPAQPQKNTAAEPETDYLLLPHPDIFNAYPPEVQRKIIEWADRDVRARRDDESRRQDALVQSRVAEKRAAIAIPVVLIVLCIICATLTGILMKSAAFAIAFLIIAFAIILAVYFTRKNDLYAYSEEAQDNQEED
jgi:hypothetical protein